MKLADKRAVFGNFWRKKAGVGAFWRRLASDWCYTDRRAWAIMIMYRDARRAAGKGAEV